jgi:hypothetical protein
MRTLDQDEKNFLLELVKKDEQLGPINLASLIDPMLKNKEIHLVYKTQKAEVRFDKETFLNNPDLVPIVRATSWSLMKYVKLLEYLENTNQVYLYQEGDFPEVFTYGQIPIGNPVITSEIKDPSVIPGLIYMSYRTVVLSQSIKDYVKNNFQTQEDIKHNQNLTLGKIALVISVALGLISIFISVHYASVDKEQDVKINSNQVESLIINQDKNTRMIINQIESSSITIPDTIKTEVTNQIEIKKNK